MQRHGYRHFISYLITILVYSSVAFILFYTQTHHFVSEEKPKENVIQLSLSTFVPEVITPPKEMIEKTEEPISKEEPVVEPEIIEKPVIEKEKISEPIVEKIVPKPIKVKEKVKAKKKVEKKVVKKKVTKKKRKKKLKKKLKKKTLPKQTASKQSNSSPAEKNKFWNAVRKKIDRHKFYPRIAKKRGMQGIVKVRFTILSNGNVSNISIDGPKVFRNSARNAVKNAFPINTKNAPVSLPASITVPLRYQIR